MKPVLQVALDFVNLSQAMRVAEEAVAAGADWLEAGTPLIKSEGLEAVRSLRRAFPEHIVVADMKVMDAGRVEVEAAAKAGANVVHVLGVASDATIADAIEGGRRYDARVTVDLLEVANLEERAREAQQLGASHIGVHTPIDMQMRGELPLDDLRRVSQAVDVPIAVAGGINSETAADAIAAGASIVVVGGAITKSADATEATRLIKRAMETGERIETDLFKRGGEAQIREVLEKAAAADITEALHNTGELGDIRAIVQGARMAGRVLTVWTYPGDWAKPVEAIDQAAPGTVLVIDAGGVGPAVWGEKATLSCLSRKLAGVVIHGAIRDTATIRELGFPAFARLVTPTAGEPKGLGMIGAPLHFGGQDIRTGDWIVGDDDGVVVIPQHRAVEVANRAVAVVERESREMGEIKQGMTLGEVSELMRWEQELGRPSTGTEPPAAPPDRDQGE